MFHYIRKNYYRFFWGEIVIMKNEVIIIGWVNYRKPAVCGETMKNQLLINRLEQLGLNCYVMDFYKWRKRPQIFLKLFYTLVVKRKATIIFSTSTENVYPMMKLMKFISWRQNTVHWVIGGSLGEKVIRGIYRSDVIGYMKWTLVESNIMLKQLTSMGVKNVIQVPNFKPIDYIPIKGNTISKKIKFVFLSRIIPEKGCNDIISSVEILNEKGFIDSFSVDFYGKIAEDYEQEFINKVNKIDNVTYCGFMNLNEKHGYDLLASYDIMLFPTFWKGEGFAGIFIDAFIAGLPIIASDWAHNRQFLEEGKTALFIPVHDINALSEKMKECILGKYDLVLMSNICQKEASKYNINNVVTESLLKKVNILS